MANPTADSFEVPLLFAPTPDETASPTPALEPLVYKIGGAGRKVIEPEIDLDAYRFEAVIDWIEIGIHTRSSTNYQTVNRLQELTRGKVFTTELTDEGGYHRRMFRTTVQDPRPDQIARIEKHLDDHFGRPSR